MVPHECLLVSFGAGLLGRVDITDMCDEYGDHPLTKSLTHSIVKYVNRIVEYCVFTPNTQIGIVPTYYCLMITVSMLFFICDNIIICDCILENLSFGTLISLI